MVIEGTQQGAQTDAEGYYVILNVSPGRYDLRASFVGYAPQVVEGVEVNIDLTTEQDFSLQEGTVGLDEITIQAREEVIKRDVSANVANLSNESIENLPVASLDQVIEMQAGIESGLSVRGSSADEVNFMVDGLSMRNARNNTPFTGVSYTSVDAVQIQTGGFNAEYGNVRSGLLNVSTREGPRDRFVIDVLSRYSPPQKEYAGIFPNHPESYYMRPYTEPEVAFVGTHSDESPWDPYTQKQYATFEGWNSVSESLNGDDDPSNDLTPSQAQEVFLFHHRKPMETAAGDYTFDGSVGGPVPLLSDPLGDLRFFTSYRQTQDAYMVPQRRNSYRERTGQVKLTSDVGPRMKLSLLGMYAKQLGMNGNGSGDGSGMFSGRGEIVSSLHTLDGAGIFAQDVFSLSDIEHLNIGGKFTHTLSSNTLYEVRLQRNQTDYFTRPGPARSEEIIEQIGPMELDEAPFGYDLDPSFGLAGGTWFGGRYATGRDTSNVDMWTGRFDLTTQVDQINQVKAGVEYYYTDYHSRHGVFMPSFASASRPKYIWRRQPSQGAAYVQNKLEFESMVANVGLRLDYVNPGGQWYNYETYERAFATAELDNLEQSGIDPRFGVSPRLGISFPTSENTKLFFNYGHFRTVQNTPTLFQVAEKETGGVSHIGNPFHAMPKTVAYELGYEQSLFDQYLLRITGYYKALDNQPRTVSYTSLDGVVQYSTYRPYNYEDIRGFEATIRKNVGQWVRGFANVTYMVRKEGNFGYANIFENRLEQRRYERDTVEDRWRPVPEPFAYFNIEFLVPDDFGPSFSGLSPLADWRLSWLGNWRAGDVFTWSGGTSEPGLTNNVRWADYYNLDLRLTKNFSVIEGGDARFFIDVSNVFNLRHLNRAGSFVGSKRDWEAYMMSLRLPEDTFAEIDGAPYNFIPGNDQPGDYRKPGVEFVPIEIVESVDGTTDPLSRPLYYEQGSGRYMRFDDGSWSEANSRFVEDVLETKAYIDMPNMQSFRFLNPRRVTLGLRVSF